MTSEDDPEWDKDTAEIQSLDSDELHETRPNRWAGSASTWTTVTARDRGVYAALEGQRRADLAVHLYNAAALQRRRLQVVIYISIFLSLYISRVVVAECVALRGVAGEKDARGREWSPGATWTAWPMRAREVPDDGLMARAADASGEGSAGVGMERWSTAKLEEEVSATILRYAKEKFLRRGRGEPEDDGKDESQQRRQRGIMESIEAVDDTGGSSSSSSSSVKGGERKEGEEETGGAGSTPVPIADDEYSYALLRPASRRILTRLDDTLTILHNARVAGLQGASESSTDTHDNDDEETEADGGGKPRAQNKRGRPRRASPSRMQQRQRDPRKGGRPRKVHVPREGETYRDMAIRIARESKRRLPTFYGDGAQTEEDVRRRKERPRSESRASSATSKQDTEEGLARWALRDWRDVLGAAAMAGFAPSVIKRAAQRCATLFGQPMSIHTLPEQPAGPGAAGMMQTSTYTPSTLAAPSSSEYEDDDPEEALRQIRAVSRQAGVRPGSSPSPPEASTEGSATSRRQHRSATPGGERWFFCPDVSCPRALEGFTRRANLVRHRQIVHGKGAATTDDEDDNGNGIGDEVDSVDEMDGAIHRDRFLQPIKARKGWRGEDTTRRERVRRRGRQQRSEMGSASSDPDAQS